MPQESQQLQKVALYARVSTEEQREGQTIDSQVAELERFARDRGWLVVGVYRDAGWSGGILARPELDRLRDDAAKGMFEAVLINDVDRLARDVSHLGVIKRDLERRGVRVVFRKLPSEESPTQNLMVNILGSFAEFERELIGDRTRRGRRYKVETRQLYLGAIPPFGYRYVPKSASAGKDGYLEIVPADAAVVRDMFRWVAEEGLSGRRVLLRLNHLGVRPRKGAMTWGKSSVMRILRSEVYAGVWHYNKYESVQPQKPLKHGIYRRSPKSSRRRRDHRDWIPVKLSEDLQIVDRATWEKAQIQITRNITFSPRNAKHRYLLSGLVRCAACNTTFAGDPCHGKYYYRCLRRCKKVPTIPEATLDEAVWSGIRHALDNPEVVLKEVSRLQARRLAAVGAVPKRKEGLNESLQGIAGEESRLLEAYRKAILSPVQLATELESLNARKVAAERQLSDLPQLQPELSVERVRMSVTEFCRAFANRIDQLNDEKRQQFLRSIVRSILYDGTTVRINCILPNRPTVSTLKSDPPIDPTSGTPEDLGAIAAKPMAWPNSEVADAGRIQTPLLGLRGHNPTWETSDFGSLIPDGQSTGVCFELEEKLIAPKKVILSRGPNGRILGRKAIMAMLMRVLIARKEAMRQSSR